MALHRLSFFLLLCPKHHSTSSLHCLLRNGLRIIEWCSDLHNLRHDSRKHPCPHHVAQASPEDPLVVGQVESRTRCMASATSRCSTQYWLVQLGHALGYRTTAAAMAASIASTFVHFRSFSKCAASGMLRVVQQQGEYLLCDVI
jgi:hypothetical protein